MGDVKVIRVDGFIEHAKWYNKISVKTTGSGTQSSISFKKSNAYAYAISKIFGGDSVSVDDDNVLGIDGYDPDKIFMAGENDFTKFLGIVHNKFKKNGTLNIVVGHGDYIRTHILAGVDKRLGDKAKFHPNNLDSFLIFFDNKRPNGELVTQNSTTEKLQLVSGDEAVQRMTEYKYVTAGNIDMDKAPTVIDDIVGNVHMADRKKFTDCSYNPQSYTDITGIDTVLGRAPATGAAGAAVVAPVAAGGGKRKKKKRVGKKKRVSK